MQELTHAEPPSVALLPLLLVELPAPELLADPLAAPAPLPELLAPPDEPPPLPEGPAPLLLLVLFPPLPLLLPLDVSPPSSVRKPLLLACDAHPAA